MPSAGHRERLLKRAEYRWTRLHNMCWATLSIWDKYLCFVLFYFFCPKDDSIFLERQSSPWFVLFGAPPSNQPLWRTSLQERRKKLKRNLKWLKDNQELTNFEFYTDMGDRKSAFKEKRKEKKKSNLKPFEPKISHLSNLYTIPPWVLCTICCIVIVTVLRDLAVPGDYVLLM